LESNQKRGCAGLIIPKRKKESRRQSEPDIDDSETTNDSENLTATTTSEVIKSLWNQLESEGVTTNLMPNGIVKNKKRMRFQTKTISLENESD
jgi:[histone H3]-trimethyl-L-lysine9/36 demethylase